MTNLQLEVEELVRRGSELLGQGRSWKMMGVHGPLQMDEPNRQYFRIETTEGELLVYRRPEERGMRRLFLLSAGFIGGQDYPSPANG